MQILTTAQMREADRRTIEEIGIPGRVLMESAGRTVVRKMCRAIPELSMHPVEVVCGKGNNGGDGLVVFRYLATQGYSVRAWVLAPLESLSGDAKANLDAALKLGLPVQSVPDEPSLSRAFSSFSEDCVVVDAILGTGLTSAARGLPEIAIHLINQISAFKVAVDVPSGLSSDSGAVPGAAVDADLTVALAAPKLCHMLPPACFLIGQLEIVDIGIPRQVLEAVGSDLETVELDDLSMLLEPRRPDSHKGSFGHLLVVAGSVGKTGAAIMAAHAALRTGVGLVTVASPARALPMMTPALPEAMWEPLDETAAGALAVSALSRVLDLLDGKTALALGPGVGRHPETVSFVKNLVTQAKLPTVVDADGINAFEDDIAAIPPDRPLAFTPHPGEAARLLACTPKDIQRDRLAAIRQLTAQSRAFAAIKGYRTLIGEPSGRVHVNLTGNAGMASGGTGDVLTGVVGSFLAQGFDVPDALRLGAYLHGLSGDLAADELGEIPLTATDLIRKLPSAIQCLTSAQ
jgi:NAD(P)H-hydrate epimerase